jgi:hypothetical protein
MTARLFGFCLFAAGLGIAAIAVVTNLPWLIAENQRIEPWKIPIVWSSEAAAFLCFVAYGVRQLLPPSLVFPRASRLTVKAFFIAVAFDLAFSIHGMIEERWAHSVAVPAQAQVHAGHSFVQWTGDRRYSLTCAFVNRDGQLQSGWYSLLSADVPPEVRLGVDGRKLPVGWKVAYDPNRPSRSWPAHLPYSDNDRLFMFSLITLLFSGLLTANLAVFRKWLTGLPPPEVGPFLGAAVLLFTVGRLQGW